MSDEQRKLPYSNFKMHHPMITWGVIISIIALTGSGIKAVNFLENKVQANEGEIEHQKELRAAENARIKADLNELKQDSKEIKKLINQLLFKLK